MEKYGGPNLSWRPFAEGWQVCRSSGAGWLLCIIYQLFSEQELFLCLLDFSYEMRYLIKRYTAVSKWL